MGGGGGGGMFSGTKGSSRTSVNDNISSLASKFPLTAAGYFGSKGKSSDSSKRNIKSDDPIKTAKAFYHTVSNGGSERPMKSGKGVITEFSDGSTVTYRAVSSSDGSPAVEITITHPDAVKPQKIHFVKE